ncbi:unnamed protein product [Rotaria sp. Silwood1]|nr:unnamed protein product [Rotaria sp. Silwood1]
MVKSKSSDKGNGKGFFSRVAPDKVAAAIAYVGDRTDQLKSETWRLNMKTKMPGSLWGEIINELKLQHDEKTRHALYDLWHSNREDIQKLVEKQKRFDRGQEYDTDIEHTSGKEENSGFEGKVSLVAEPSLPLPAPPNTRMNEHKNVNHNGKNLIVEEVSFIFTVAEWKNAFSCTSQKMKDDWTDVFYEKLVLSGMKCPVKFKTPYIKKGKRKKRCRFFCCYAICTIDECPRKYQISIRRQPDENSSILFLVRIFGEESHNPAIARSARHISGSQRFLLGKRANDIGPLALYRELVDNADRALLEVGNETQCPTTETLKKAAADYRNKMRIDENIFRACRIIRQVYIKEDNKSEHIRGYIHDVSEVPFRVHLYTELQIRRYINYVKSETYSCVHIDATGGILKKMHEEKQSLLYALIFKDGIDAGDTVPLAHAILNDHTVPSISFFFGKLAYHIVEVQEKLILPAFFIIDFSAATMNAVLQAFNVENINTHLNRCWNVIKRKYNKKELRSLSFIHLCCCHVIHAMARSLSAAGIDKKIRRSVLHILAFMLCSNDIDQLYDTLGMVINIFGDTNEQNGKEKLERIASLDFNVDEESKSMLKDDVKVTNDQPSKSLHSQQQYQPESLIGTRILRWPKFGVYDATYEGQLYSLTLTCPIDTALFCLYFVYETDINVAEELKKASESSSYATLIKTFDLVKTEGWDSARIFWLRAFNILKKYDKQPKSLFSSVDETVFKFLRTQQRHITKITCSRSDCAQRERDCSSTEIDMFCSDEQIEKFAIEAIGTCQAMIKRYDEITKIEALQKKYKEGRVYTFNIETNKHEYVQGWMCDSVNVQSKATFVYGHPPIVILNIKPFSKRHEEGYEATTVRLRDIKRTIRIGSIKYQLRAVINHKDDHFTTTLIELDGSLYIFDDLQGVRDTRTSTDRVEMAIYTKIYTF